MSKDNLLYRLIELDLKTKGKTICHISDELVNEPTEIEVGANEVVYTYLFHTNTADEFSLDMISPTEVINYNFNNVQNGSNTLIKSHWGKIKFSGATLLPNFTIQYVRIKFSNSL